MKISLCRRAVLRLGVVAFACLVLVSCSPKFDWREVNGSAAPYTALLPAKPATHARDIDLDGLAVNMTMTGAEVDDVTFAIGTISLSDAGQSARARDAMKTALTRNINGTVIKDEIIAASSRNPAMSALEVSGPMNKGQRLLLARFVSNGPHVYQLLVVGDASKVSREAADNFFTSFSLPK